MSSTSDIYESIRLRQNPRCECGHFKKDHNYPSIFRNVGSERCVHCHWNGVFDIEKRKNLCKEFTESFESYIATQREIERLLG